MIGVHGLLERLALRTLRLRASQIAELARNPLVTVYPRELTFEGPPIRVLLLTPHADDETFGAGGTLLRHLDKGDQVEVLLFSDNVMSIDDDAMREERKIEHREEEFACAMARLGIERWAALRIGNREFRQGVHPDSAFTSLIENHPDVLYLPSLFDNHHDHRMLNAWLLRTLQEHRDVRPLIRGFEVWSPLPATAVADITAWIDRKHEAIRCYESQNAAIDYRHHIDGLNAYRAMTLGGKRARYAEAFLELPADLYLELGKSFILSYIDVC
ncbi:MAG: PIG-L family deacetylase [Bacteroidota bacterium]|jgi:LmbE family N-acetylglucosaminyl deacetylase|nr:PIG-L family deacetylase [Bacteroidota bacterium]